MGLARLSLVHGKQSNGLLFSATKLRCLNGLILPSTNSNLLLDNANCWTMLWSLINRHRLVNVPCDFDGNLVKDSFRITRGPLLKLIK